MIKVGMSGTAARIVAMAGLTVLLAGCGGDDGSATAAQTAGNTGSMPIDRSGTDTAAGMQIQGSPETSAQVGQAYSFQPSVPGATSGSVQYSISTTPPW